MEIDIHLPITSRLNLKELEEILAFESKESKQRRILASYVSYKINEKLF